MRQEINGLRLLNSLKIKSGGKNCYTIYDSRQL